MKRLISLIVIVCLPLIVFAIPDKPSPSRLVNDLADVFSSSQERQLEQKVLELFKATSTQIAVVTVNDLEGAAVSSYAFEIGAKWGVGSKKFDNGIVVLLKPKTTDSRGEVFIATGYGLEGAVPDAIAKRIVENEMIPWFKKGNYFNGVDAGVDVIIGLTKGEYSAQQYAQTPVKKTRKKSWGILPLIIIVVVFRLLFARRSVGLGHALPWWFLFSSMGASSHRGSFNDFSNSSGKFGGGDFGGFGGFGGGSFGGGGAGGSW